MTKLGDLYTDFSRIDLDARGGYARVAEVKAFQKDGNSVQRAFKLLRPEIDFRQGMQRFKEELQLLAAITKEKVAPNPITRIYDSGFAPVELSYALHQHNAPNLMQEIISTGIDVSDFIRVASDLRAKEIDKWQPYIVVELAPYNDSLLRQIHHQPQNDPAGLYRLPTGEVIAMALQLLEVIDYLHTKHGRTYMDWKPEHIFWSGLNKQVKLIDWNVTTSIEDGPGERQNIRDDIRLFCGAALYISLTFIDPEDPMKAIGPRPTEEFENPVPEIRRRYWTSNPSFHQRDVMLDQHIKQIIQKGLNPNQGFDSTEELKNVLLEYAQQDLGLSILDFSPFVEPKSGYFKALAEIRSAQHQLVQAQQHLIDAIEANGETLEFTRLFETIKRALINFPVS